jgi:uncharacterized tellurite resistance protein B-like protein
MNNSDAAFTLFMSMCFADGDWHDTEGNQAFGSLTNLGLNRPENPGEIIKKLADGDSEILFEAGQQVSGWSTKEKLAMVTEMSRVAHADNDFDEKEMKFIVLFGSMWGIEKDDLLNATFAR